MAYIMSPLMFRHLSYTNGFNEMQGKTYQEHITIALYEYLTDEQRKEIKKSSSPEFALTILKKYVNYTHEYKKKDNYV